MPRTDRSFGVAVLVVLALATVATVFAILPPSPLGIDADPEQASATRAMDLVCRVAVEPHAAGVPEQAAEHARVRAELRSELEELGFDVETQRGELRHELTNLLVSVDGSASTGIILCMAHYDSVPQGPGAADDAAGVTAWIEVLRALRARGWQPRNDVLLLLTDGEERGLLGARMFARDHRRAADVATVVNLEAIGSGGRALLFQLGERNGVRVAEYAGAVDSPAGSSLAEAVYEVLPNDTDLSVFLARGVEGFNVALTCNSCVYHSPYDRPENLDPGSLQHLCDTAEALLLRLGALDLATLSAPDVHDVTFFDVLGLHIVRWPRRWDLWLAIGALGLVALAVLARRQRWRAVGAAVLRFVVASLILSLVLFGLWWAIDFGVKVLAPPSDWIPGNTTSGALLFVGLWLLGLGIGAPGASVPTEDADRRMLGGLLVVGVLGVAACLLLPGASYAFSVPVLLLAAQALLGGVRVVGRFLGLVALVASSILGLQTLHLLMQLMQREPVVAAAFGALVAAGAACLFAPFLRAVVRVGWWGRATLLGLGLAALLGSVAVARLLLWRSGCLWP